MSCRRSLSFAAAALLTLPLPALGQSLEGVIRQRTVDVEDDALFELVYADSENEPDFANQADWLRSVAEKLFAIPVDGLAGEASEVTIHVRGTMLRYEDGSGNGYVITDLATMNTRIVDPSTRSYVEYSVEDAQAAVAEAQKQAEEMMARMGIDPDDAQADATSAEYASEEDGIHFTPRAWALDRTEEVNGVPAEVFEAEAGSEIGLAWCGEDPAGMRPAMERLASQVVDPTAEGDAFESQGPSVEDLLCEQGIPVRTKILSMRSAGDLAFNVTEILSMERTPVSPDIFEVPAGYTKKSMADLWR